MKIETWDKQEVLVEATISVGAQSNETAKLLLDRINIKEEKTTTDLSFITSLGNWSYNDTEGGHEMRINVIIHIPSDAKLRAVNRFGALIIGDYRGPLDLHCRYGNLTAGRLSNADTIHVEFGKANIAQLSNCNLLFRYAGVEIEKLSGKISGELHYCKSIDLSVDGTLEQLDLKNNYTSLYLLAAKDLSIDYDITTQNASASGKNEWKLKEEEKPEMRNNVFLRDHHYNGSLGKSGSKTRIQINSRFGNIRLIPG